MSNIKDTGDLKIKLKNGQVIKFRTVRNSDTELFLKYFDDLSARSRYFFHPGRFDLEHAESITKNANSGDTYRLVAVQGEKEYGRIVGYAWIQGLEKKDYIPMLGIGIIDEYHNVGLGKAMMKLMIERAKQLNLDRLKLGVFDDNPRAIHIYESVGFRIDPTIPPRKENEHTEIYMIIEIKDCKERRERIMVDYNQLSEITKAEATSNLTQVHQVPAGKLSSRYAI